jgi:hypothetical protein
MLAAFSSSPRNSGARADVLLPNTMDLRMSSYPHLASAALVAAFFMAMLVTANRFTEYRSMKVQAIGVVQVRGLPLGTIGTIRYE